LRAWSPDGTEFLANRKDEKGVYQVYKGAPGQTERCLTCAQVSGGPSPGRNKIMPVWHPSKQWIFLAVERDNYEKPLVSTQAIVEGLMLSGGFVNMWAMRPDGEAFTKLTDFGGLQKDSGYTGPAFTPDGRQAVWAEIVDNNPIGPLFGKWELRIGDVREVLGHLVLRNIRNITPAGALWVEPGTFSPDGRSLLITADIGMPDPQGQDQYVLDIVTGAVRNLNNTPRIWDEHGVFSPDGEKVLFMSSYPWRTDPFQHGILSLKTEFMLMNKDGSNLQQITNFLTPGFPEYSPANGLAANGYWNPDGRSLSVQTLYFSNLQFWTITFAGPCGKR
jgi:hypothetical protein